MENDEQVYNEEIRNEDQWTEKVLKELVKKGIQSDDELKNKNIEVECFKKLFYSVTVTEYRECKTNENDGKGKKDEKDSKIKIEPVFEHTDLTHGNGACYETDLMISQKLGENKYIPLVVVEVKLNDMSTHDIIAYNHKAGEHKRMHKNLMYGVVIASQNKLTINKLLNHELENFDFVFCFKNAKPQSEETKKFMKIIKEKIIASQQLYEIFYSKKSKHFSYINKKLDYEI